MGDGSCLVPAGRQWYSQYTGRQVGPDGIYLLGVTDVLLGGRVRTFLLEDQVWCRVSSRP